MFFLRSVLLYLISLAIPRAETERVIHPMIERSISSEEQAALVRAFDPTAVSPRYINDLMFDEEGNPYLPLDTYDDDLVAQITINPGETDWVLLVDDGTRTWTLARGETIDVVMEQCPLLLSQSPQP
jgi:hypothetical protein